MSFTRDGRRLVALDDALSIVELASGHTTRIAIDEPRAAVGFSDQVWVAHGHDVHLTRFALDGCRIGRLPLVGEGTLAAAPVGAPAAVWASTMVLADGDGVATAVLPKAELVLPLTARRWVAVTGARVVAPSGLSCELAGTRVQGGAVILDGTAVALVAERAGTREIVTVGITNGRLRMRQAIGSGVARIAVRRGVVALLREREVTLIDLRSGHTLGEVHAPFAVTDFAIDPDAEILALRDGGTTIELLDVREALAAKVAVEVDAEGESEDAPVVEVTTATKPAAAVVPIAPVLMRPFDLRCLSPLARTETVDRSAALALLDVEVRGIALRTVRAIADAWDTLRLGYGNEGHHAYEHEVAALLGLNRGHATSHVEAAAALLDEHAAAVTAARGAQTPLTTIAAELGLSALAVEILLVVAAPALWSEAARLFGILANDPARPLVDEALVEQILDTRASRHAIAAELDPRAPLVRLGVLESDAKRARPFAALSVAPVVLARLRRELPDLGVGVTVRGSDRAVEELVVAPGVVAGALAALARVDGPARIVVRGRPGSGRRTLVAALAAEANRALGVVDMALIGRGEHALAGALRRVQLAGLVPCIVGLEDITFGERDAREVIVEVLRVHPGPLAIVIPVDQPALLDAGYVAIDMPVLDEGQRAMVWRDVLADSGLAAHPELLASRYRIGPGAIHRAVAAAGRDHARGADVTHAIERFIRQARDARIGQHARRIERLATWDSLVLPPDILDSLRELVGRVRHRRTVFETWGMEQTMATSRGLTALFSGPPGTGKTLVAGVIARELGLELYQIDLSKLMSKWIGETERNLSAIFDAAEDGQVILLFDEADSLFAKRTEVRSSNDRYANLEVNYLLQRLDTFEGIALLTTNASGSIDPAFKRRLSFRLSFPFPDEETREQLWRAHLPATVPTRGPLAFDNLAHKYQISGGYIRNACLRATFLAAADETPLMQHHLDRAVTLEYAELGKLSNSGALD